MHQENHVTQEILLEEAVISPLSKKSSVNSDEMHYQYQVLKKDKQRLEEVYRELKQENIRIQDELDSLKINYDWLKFENKSLEN